MQSATNIKMGRREDRSLLCVCFSCPGNCFNFLCSDTYTSQAPESIRLPMFTVLDATNALGGSTTKLLIYPRNIRKVGLVSQIFYYLAHWKFKHRKISFGAREAGEGECLEIGRPALLNSGFYLQ